MSVVAIALVLAGLALRLHGIMRWSLEGDELYTVMESRDLFDTKLRPGIEARPLFFLVEHVLMGVLPAGPFWLRLLPLVFGTAAMWATWRLGSLVAGPVAGLVALIMAVTSPWLMYASAFARYWSLLHLLTVLFFLFVLKAQAARDGRMYLLALLVAVLGSATHPTFLFAPMGFVLGLYLVTKDGHWGSHWPDRQSLLRLWLPWFLIVVIGMTALKLTDSSAALQNFGGRGPIATLMLLPAIVQWMTPMVFAAGAIGVMAALTRPALRRWGLAAALGSCSVMGLLVLAAARTDVYADYGIALLPFAHVSVGILAVVAIENRRNTLIALLASIAILLAGVLPSTASHLIDGTRFDYRPAIAHIRQVDAKLPVIGWPEVIMQHYGTGLMIRPFRVGADDLTSTLATTPAFWMILSAREYGFTQIEQDTEAWLAAHCKRSGSWHRMRLDSRQYRVELFKCGM